MPTSEPLSLVLSKLNAMGKQVSESGGRYSAQCPAHDDQNASLSISIGAGGKVLLKCQAGCRTDDVLTAMGLKMRDLFPQSNSKPRSRIVATYAYANSDGTDAYEVVRFEPKDFRQRRSDGNGGYVWKMDGVQRILYRLPELLAADTAVPVLIVEGEKDVDNLYRLGFIATCNPGGAGKFGKIKDLSALAGRTVFIVADKDPAGRKHAIDVAGRVKAMGILELPGDAVKDASDWISAGGTAEQLWELLADAPTPGDYNREPQWETQEPVPLEVLAASEGESLPMSPNPESGMPADIMDRPTELANAETMIRLYGRDLRYDLDELGKSGNWMHWTGQVWEVDESIPAQMAIDIARATAKRLERLASARVVKHAEKMETARGVSGVLGLARRLPGVSIRHTAVNADAWLLPCANVTLDLLSMTSRPHLRDDLFTLQAPVTYNPEAECPQWIKFIDRIFDANDPLIDYVQRIAGLCLTGDASVQELFVFYGQGANGKSTFLDTISGILGPFACQAPENLLVQNRNDGHPCDMMSLDGKRMVMASETEEGARLRNQRVKKLTGDVAFSARGVNENFRQVVRRFKLIMSTNNRPVVTENTEAMWRRIKLIPFEVIIPVSERDKTLIDKFRGEWSGILNWCLSGLRRFRDRGMETPNEVTAATEVYRGDQDDGFADFSEACLIVGEGMECTKASVWEEYQLWSKRHGIKRPLDKPGLFQRLRNTPGVTDDQRRIDGKPTRTFVGIGVTKETTENSGVTP